MGSGEAREGAMTERGGTEEEEEGATTESTRS